MERLKMTTQFQKELNNPYLSVIIDLSLQDKPLLIAFGGIAGSLSIPPFEFFGLTSKMDVNKIYLRDLSQTWYHAGLPGISSDIDETVCFLRRKIDQSHANRVIVFGNSMGGYAALLFGILLKADIVHAFSPHTFLYDEACIRSKKQIRSVHNLYSGRYFDINDLLSKQGARGELHVYYDDQNELDRKHALHLHTSPDIYLHSFQGGGHALVKILKDSGKLAEIIVSSLTSTRKKIIN